MNRNVQPELLDELPPDDPRAVASRRDLATLNAIMGHASVVANALRGAFAGPSPPRHVIELGAGDGRFLLGVARRLAPGWPGVAATLLDQQSIISSEVSHEFEKLGWPIETLK